MNKIIRSTRRKGKAGAERGELIIERARRGQRRQLVPKKIKIKINSGKTSRSKKNRKK